MVSGGTSSRLARAACTEHSHRLWSPERSQGTASAESERGRTRSAGGGVPVNAEQIEALIPELLENRYPGQYRNAMETGFPELPGGWVVEPGGLVCLVRSAGTSNPFIWIKIGVAIEVPRSPELAYYVAAANKKLDVGRAYMGYGDDLALVVMDETVFAASLSWQFEPSVSDVLSRFQASLTQARNMAEEIFERFGGRSFASDEWMHLAF
jgi:hypothetical protein